MKIKGGADTDEHAGVEGGGELGHEALLLGCAKAHPNDVRASARDFELVNVVLLEFNLKPNCSPPPPKLGGVSGDTLYPGRLYVNNWAEYEKSITRLVNFLDGKPVAHILGAHIEQSATPYLDYPVRTSFQPLEHSLELSRATLLELQRGLASLKGKASRVAYRDFTIWPK